MFGKVPVSMWNEPPYIVYSKRYPHPEVHTEPCLAIDDIISHIRSLLQDTGVYITDILIVRLKDGAYQIARGGLVFDSPKSRYGKQLHSEELVAPDLLETSQEVST